MITGNDLQRKALEIGARIDALVDEDPRELEVIADELGFGMEALKKLRAGKSSLQHAKLAVIATVLRTTPNRLLGFDGGAERELLRGALEGAYTGLGRPPAQAHEFAEAFLRILDRPEVSVPGQSPADRGKILADFLIREFVDLKRQLPTPAAHSASAKP